MRFLGWAVIVVIFWAGFFILSTAKVWIVYVVVYAVVAAIAVLISFDKLLMRNNEQR